MPTILTDVEIQSLIAEPKPLPPDVRRRLRPKPKRGHDGVELSVVGAAGSEFIIMVRQSRHDPLNFSVILAHRPKTSTGVIRLRRYNGKSHDHTNTLEGPSCELLGFHIHYATERYQAAGLDEDGYAEATDRYTDVNSAVSCLFADCGFLPPPEGLEQPLF